MAQESAQEEGTDIRRKAAVRLGIAALVTVLALGALWWLDRSGKEKPKPKPATPAPIVSAPSPTPPATPVEPAPPEAGREPPVEETPPPPPSPAMTQPAPAKAAQPAATATRRPAAATTPPTSTRQPPEPARPAMAPSNGGFVVQLGVFSNPKNAQELVDRLAKLGIRAYTETRVHVGPFLNKAEADKAQAELKRLGISGLVGPAGTTK